MSRKNTALATPGRLDPTLVVLRKVDVKPLSVRVTPSAPTIMELIGGGYAEQALLESELNWFQDGYILNDQPRTSIVTDEIMQNTLGYAVANTDSGEVIREFGADGFKQAVDAVASAKIELKIDVALADDDDDMPDDFDPENPEAYLAAQAAADYEFEIRVEAEVQARMAARADDVVSVPATPIEE